MSDVAAAIRAKLDGMVEGSGDIRWCAGCEGDCYCQAWLDYQNALAAVLELHQPIDGDCPICLDIVDPDTCATSPCSTLLAIAKALGVDCA